MSRTTPLLRLLLVLAILLGLLPAPRLSAQEPVTPDVPSADAPPANSLFLPLMAGGGSDTTHTAPGDTSFRFVADPLLGTVSVDETPAPQSRPATARSSSRLLLPDSELSRVQFTYEFQTGNRLVIRAAYQNVTDDALFLQPFAFIRNNRTDNIVSSVEPVLDADDLGGDAILSPDETTRVVLFEVVHKGQPFTYAVDALAPVELLSAQAGPTDPAVFTGEVYDDSTGLALPGVTVEVVSKARSLSPTVTRTVTDERGRYRLVSEDRDVWVRFAKEGYTGSERAASAPAESRVELFDARVTPLDSKEATIPAVSGGAASATDARYSLTLQPFALQNDTALRLTPLGGQSIAGLLPKGWSPVAAVQIDPAGLTFDPAAVLSLPAPDGLPESGRIVAARWERALQGWVAIADATRNGDNTALQLALSASGQYVLLLADAAPFAPEDPLTGAILRQAASPRSLPGNPAVAMSPSDRILLAEPGRKTEVGVTAIAAEAMQSGMAYQVEFAESYEFVDGEIIYPEPNIQDFVFYAFPGGPFRLESDFNVTPSRPFELATLRRGTVELRLRAPVGLGLPSGELVSLTGRTVTGAAGETLELPPAATLSTLPVVLTSLEQSGFPFALPADFVFLKGVQLDFAGGALQRPAALSVAAPSGLTGSDQLLLLRLVEVGSSSRLVLAGRAQLLDGRLVAGPQTNDSLPFFGVRREGRYAFVKVTTPRSFVYGVVAGTKGQPLVGGLVTAEQRRLAALTDPNGQYVLAVHPGPVTVVFANPQTNDQATRSGEVGGTPLQLNVSLSPTPPSVQSLFPANGASGISLSSAIVVTFTEAIDASSVSPESVRLLVNGAPLPTSLSITPNRRVVVLRPSQLLESDTLYSVEITTAIRDLNARPLTEAVTASFRTADTTPPLPPPAGSVTASVPVGGFSTVTGSQGTVQPDWVVVIKNLNTGALTTVLPEADGSFSVRVPAERSHKLQLQMQDASGNRTEVAVGRFTSPDGSVVVGSEGGTVEGEGGTAVDIPAGAFPEGTLVKVEPLALDNLPGPGQPNAPSIGAVVLNTDGQMGTKPLDLSIPAPADAAPEDVVLVARFVTWPGGSGWVTVDRAKLDGDKYTTAGSAQAAGRAAGLGKMLLNLTGLAWQKGIFSGGSYSFFQHKPDQWDCISFVQVEWGPSADFLITSSTGPLIPGFSGLLVPGIFPPEVRVSQLPAICNATLEIEIINPRTDRLIQKITRKAPAQKNIVGGQSPNPQPGENDSAAVSADRTPPQLIRHNLYSYYQLEKVSLLFSKQMNPDSVFTNVRIINLRTGELLEGKWEVFNERVKTGLTVYEESTLFAFTPNVHFEMGTQYMLFLGPAEDATPNRNKLPKSEMLFTAFTPHSVVDLTSVIGPAGGSQAAVDIGDTIFVFHQITDTSGVGPVQSLSIVNTKVLTDPLLLQSTPTGLFRLRAAQAIPDVFVESPNAHNFPLEIDATQIVTSYLRPVAILTTTLTITQTDYIQEGLAVEEINEELKTLFAEMDRPLHRRATVTRKFTVLPTGPVEEYLLRTQNDIYQLRRLDDGQFQISVGRDLLAVLGTTERLPGKMELLEIYDVTPCTKPEAFGLDPDQPFDCFNFATMTVSRKVLTDPDNALALPVTYPNGRFVPKEIGVPTQLTVANVPEDGVAALYLVNSGIGIQALDVQGSPNMPSPLTTRNSLAPTGLLRGSYNDVALSGNRVLAVRTMPNGRGRLDILDNTLAPVQRPSGTEPFFVEFSQVFGVAGARFVFDVDEDGNLGEAEADDVDKRPLLDDNGQPTRLPDGSPILMPFPVDPVDEIFDLAFVTAQVTGSGGALWVIDINSATDPGENRFSPDLRILAAIPLPPGARSVSVSPERKAAYVELTGQGLYVIDLNWLLPELVKESNLRGTDAPAKVDVNKDEVDDRILGVYDLPSFANRGDFDLGDDPNRPVVLLSKNNQGVDLVRVCNNCQELLLDFRADENWVDQNATAPAEEGEDPQSSAADTGDENEPYLAEYDTLLYLLERVVVSLTTTIAGVQPQDIYVIEQGSGGCFWRPAFQENPARTCAAFTPRISDHDYELFLPAEYVRRAQTVMDAFVRKPPTKRDKDELGKLEDFTLFAMPREPFDLGVLLSSPPMNKEGDTAGDLGLGRQALLVLWLLTTGEYPPVGRYAPDVEERLAKPENAELARRTAAPDLEELVRCLSINQMYNPESGACDERPAMKMFGNQMYPSIYFTDTVQFTPGPDGQPSDPAIEARGPITPQSGIPPVEGYEWAVLQEYNLYKTGAALRIKGGCNFETSNADAAEGEKFYFTNPDRSDDLPPNHPDRAFDDADAFDESCKSQLKTVGKSAIRTAFAVMAAHPKGNGLLLQGRYRDEDWEQATGLLLPSPVILPVTRANLLSEGYCLTGVDDVFNPPTNDPFEFYDRDCQGFEDYVVTMAVESYRRGYQIFNQDEMALIWQFWCVKVWKGCSDSGVAPIRTESEANEFIRQAMAFIERAQQRTLPIYRYTSGKDATTLQALVANPLAPMNAYPFMTDICGVCSGDTFNGDFLLNSSRGSLRRCNIEHALAKVYGDPAKHQEILNKYFADEPVYLTDDVEMAQVKKLGVKYSVVMKLQSRVGNASANDLYDVLLGIYEGPATDRADYRERLGEYAIPYLPAGARTIIDEEKVPNSERAAPPPLPQCAPLSSGERPEYPLPVKETKDKQIFTAVFAITQTLPILQTSQQARAVAFVIDPDEELVEVNKANNQTAFYYYPLDRSAEPDDNTPALNKETAPFVLSEFASGAICLTRPLLDLDVTARRLDQPNSVGQKQLVVDRDTEVEYIFTVRNTSSSVLRNIKVEGLGRTLFTVNDLAPEQNFTHKERDRLTRIRGYNIEATARAKDPEGNDTPPVSDRAWVAVQGQLVPISIFLYDDTELNVRSHPFTRWNIHHDESTGENLPIKGAVTDGAARVEIKIESTQLDMNQPLKFRLSDPLVQGETKGIGELLLENSDGLVITRGVTLDVPTPSELGRTFNVYYIPPHLFVRPDHFEIDSYTNLAFQLPRKMRKVKLEVVQTDFATGSTNIELIRPPVFLFHGLGGDPSVWNEFFPLVPVTGVSLRPDKNVSGYDGRFKVFAMGSNGTVRPTYDEAKGNYSRFYLALRNPDFKGYAISNVDVIAFSMGGVISREIARQFVEELHLPVPFGRFITIGTPHIGSPLASEVVKVRDSDDPIVQQKFDIFAISQAWWQKESVSLNDRIDVQWCTWALRDVTQFGGPYMAVLDIRSGALDDLRPESQRMAILKDAGILMPSHMIAGEANTIALGKSTQVSGLWFGLGLLCNWTPDESTVERTKLLAKSPSNIWKLVKVLAFGDWGSTFDLVKTAVESITNSGEGPKQILTTINGQPSNGNDRIVPARSQRNDAPPNARYVTRVVADTDHLAMKITNYGEFHDNSVAKCNQYMAAIWRSAAQQPSSVLLDNDLVVCLAVFLLETDPAYKSASAANPLYRPADEPSSVARNLPDGRQPPRASSQRSTDPVDIPVRELSEPPVRPQGGAVVITVLSPQPGAVVKAGERVQMTVQVPPTATLASLALVNDGFVVDVLTRTGAITYTASITLPVVSLGTQTLGAVGVSAYDTITDLVYYVGTVDVTVDPGLLIDATLAGPPILDRVGQVEQLQVYGLFADNVSRDLTPPALGTTYRSLNPAVVAVSPGGKIQARSRGSATILATVRHPVTGKAAVASLEVQVNIPPEETNQIPVAANIPDQTVGTEEIVFLNASASSDPDGDPLTYRWQQTGGRAVVLLNDGTWRPQFVSPYLTRPDTLTFELTVADDKGAETLPVEVRVTVNP